MPICTLHIGLPKTGSTSIQTTILTNRSRLAGHGIYVPQTGTDGLRHNHHEIALEFLKSREQVAPGGLLDALRGELEDAGHPGHVLISAESLHARLHNPHYVARLRDAFSAMGYGLRLIAYLRPQVAYINSFYSQDSKYLTNTLDVDAFVTRALSVNRYNYRALLMPAFRMEGVETIYRPFNREIVESGVVEDFLAALGLDATAIGAMTISPPRNISPGPKSVAAFVELGRRVSAHGIDLSLSDRREVRRAVLKLGDRLKWNQNGFSGINATQAQSIRDRFAKGNDVLASKVWSRRWEAVFGADCWTPAPYSAFDRAKASGPEAGEFDDIVERVWHSLKDGKAAELAAGTDLLHTPRPAREFLRKLRAFSAGLKTRWYTGT